MHDAVEVITVKARAVADLDAGQRLYPLGVRHQRVGVVSADRMEAEEKEDQRVGDARQRQRTEGGGQQEDRHEHKHVLEQPVVAVVRRYGQRRPEHRVEHCKRRDVTSVPHVRNSQHDSRTS